MKEVGSGIRSSKLSWPSSRPGVNHRRESLSRVCSSKQIFSGNGETMRGQTSANCEISASSAKKT